MKRMLCLFTVLFTMVGWGAAETVLLPEAVKLGEETFGTFRRIDLEIPATQERLVLMVDGDGDPLVLSTTAAGVPASDEALDARAAAEIACPGAIVLRDEDSRLTVAARDWFGTLEIHSGCVVFRDLRGGCFVNGDGLLSLDGALCAIRLLRPDADIRGIGFDEDDNEYEGEALTDGEVFEFEIDADSGRLLEWERD